MILHIVSASPYSHDALQRCLRLAADHDAILLIEDGVLAVDSAAHFLDQSPTRHLYALEPDLHARGVVQADDNVVTTVDYDGFVELTTRCDKTVSWF